MRILHITSHLNVGGITTYVMQLADGLAARGHQVIVAADHGELESRFGSNGLSHWRVPLHTKAEFSPQAAVAYWRLSRKLSDEPVDLIHAHTRVAQVVADRLAARHRVPYVTTWHGFYRRRWARRWLPCTGMRTIAISQPVARHLTEEFGLDPGRVRLVPHGIDVSRFQRPVDSRDQAALRARAGLAPGGPVVGTVARLVPSKGVSQLVAAFPHLLAKVPQAQLLIVGDGPDRTELEQLAGRLGISQRVRIAGNLPDTRAPLSLMDAFVFLPAEQEGFGLALLEAMAVGVPVAAVRRGGGSTWVLERSPVGLVVEPGDPQRLGEAIARLLQDRGFAHRLAEQARDVVRAEYDVERVITQVEQVYAECRASDS